MNSGWSVGIDLGGTNIACGLVDGDGKIAFRSVKKTNAPRPAESLADSMASCVHDLLRQSGLQLSDLSAVGVGVPGVIEPSTQILIEASNLFLKHTDFAGLLRERLPGVPVFMSNDADCAVFGEAAAGAAKDFESAFLLTLGTGVGGGFVRRGSIFRGATGYGIEPGHMIVDAGSGVSCTCGQDGCLEVYASIRGLCRLTLLALSGKEPSVLREAFPEGLLKGGCNLTRCETPAGFEARVVFDAAREGDPLACRIVERYARYLAEGIRSIEILFRPHVILIGGGISHAGDALLLPLRKAVEDTTVMRDVMPSVRVEPARLGNDAGIVGAALLYKEKKSI